MEYTEQQQVGKPKWLRKLERESWQAELIISGLAIIGSLQLPTLLDQAETYCLLNYDRDTLFICYIAAVYWRILIAGLIVLFIFHFIVRALWIGLVGLNSVYPGGFKPNERFSPHFQKKLREEFGDVDGFIQSLDRLGSGLFGIGFGIAGVFLNFGMLGVLLVFVHGTLVDRGVDPDRLLFYIGLLLSPLLLLSLVSMVLHSERFRDTPFARRYLWPINLWQSRFTYPFARRYITTSLNIVTSYYADSKAFIWYFLLGMLAMIGLGMTSTVSSNNVRFFVDNVYHRMANDSLTLTDSEEEDGVYEGLYYRPQLASAEALARGEFSVWVPLPERELHELYAQCSVAGVERGELERSVYNHLRWQRTLSCAREYLSLSINGQRIEEYDVIRENRTNAAGRQFGVRLYPKRVPLHQGINVVGVVSNYLHDETQQPREAYAVFYQQNRR